MDGRVIERLGTALPTFLDVGAGVGYYCVLVKKLRPPARVIAVEALPRHARALRSTLVLNGLKERDVELIEAAVAAITGRASLADLDYGSQLTANDQEHPGAARLDVPTLSLADLVSKTGTIDLMKMDIQGYRARGAGSLEANFEQRPNSFHHSRDSWPSRAQLYADRPRAIRLSHSL